MYNLYSKTVNLGGYNYRHNVAITGPSEPSDSQWAGGYNFSYVGEIGQGEIPASAEKVANGYKWSGFAEAQ